MNSNKKINAKFRIIISIFILLLVLLVLTSCQKSLETKESVGVFKDSKSASGSIFGDKAGESGKIFAGKEAAS